MLWVQVVFMIIGSSTPCLAISESEQAAIDHLKNSHSQTTPFTASPNDKGLINSLRSDEAGSLILTGPIGRSKRGGQVDQDHR